MFVRIETGDIIDAINEWMQARNIAEHAHKILTTGFNPTRPEGSRYYVELEVEVPKPAPKPPQEGPYR